MIFVDTVAWLYLFDARQNGEGVERARAFITNITEPLCTSDLVIAEAHQWLLHHGDSAEKAHLILDKLINQKITQIIPLENADKAQALTLIQQHAADKLSYTDATTISLMHRLGIKQVFSFARHFLLFPNIQRVPA